MEPRRLRTWAIALLIVATVGFADATYLSFEHFTGGQVKCFITTGCDTVTTSSYATVAGIPVALAGAVYYLVMMVGSLLAIDTGRAVWLRRIAMLSIAGLGASAYLLAIQAFVLHAYCIYCLGSVGTSTLLFILSALVWPKLGNQISDPPQIA